MPAHEVEHFPSPKTRSRIPRMITSESDSDARFVYERQGVGEISRGSIMFAMSACHGTRRQVVEQGRRSPRETGPHESKQYAARFFDRGGSRVTESDRGCERLAVSRRSRVS
jgi:hypothetical protein